MIAVPRSSRPEFGRWRVCRPYWLHTETLGPPLLIDKQTGRMRPYMAHGPVRDEWRERVDLARQDKRLLKRHPLIGQMSLAALFDRHDLIPMFLHGIRDVAFQFAATLALDSNYVAGTSGDAYAVRFATAENKTLDTVYFFVSSYTGTAANVNDLTLEIRPEASAGAGTPDTATLTEGQSKDPGSATGWIASTGWTAALTGLARYFAIVGDADGNGTDFATGQYRGAGGDIGGSNLASRWLPVSTTGGWASGNGVGSSVGSLFVFKFSDSSVFGNPFSAGTAPANDAFRRGLRITNAALIAPVEVFGMLWTVAATNITGIEIWDGDTGPSGTANDVGTVLLYNSAGSRLGGLTNGGNPYTLAALTAYSIVAYYSGSATTGPQRMDIGTGEDANLRAAMPGGGGFYYRRANGTTDWSNDLVGSMPAIALLLDGQVAAAGGGVIYHGGMSGGLLV